MSGLIRSDLYARSLKVYNQSSNILEMDLLGNLNFNTKNLKTDVKESIDLKAKTNLSLSTVNGNLETRTENGNIILRNGEYSGIDSLSYSYLDNDVDESSYIYFENSEIVKPYTTKESVVALRDESLLIESLNPTKKLTLYSNNGLNNIAHGNITSISDNNYIVQANNKINLTSLGFITLNSERLIGTMEEDISLFSSTGNVILGGNGVTNNGININSNTNNNFVSMGKSGNAIRALDIDVSKSSTDNTRKNGLIINNSTNAKNDNNKILNPEIELRNSNTKINIGIGADNNDLNLKLLAKKVNIGNLTYLKPLNNFVFVLNDVGRIISWSDTSYGTDKILEVINDSTHGIIARISFYNSGQVTAFNFQIGYIDRNNFSYVRTKTNSSLHLGTNNSNIINITEQGNIGINTETPNANLSITNKFGETFNNNIDTTKKYFNSKTIQLQNGNILVVSNSSYVTTYDNYYPSAVTSNIKVYNLEGFIYNDQNTLIYNFVIFEKSFIEIVFGLDNLVGENDLFVVSYTHGSYTNAFRGKKTETNIYTNTGTVVNSNLKTTVTHTTQGEDINFGSSSLSNDWRQYSGLLWKDNNVAAAKEIHEFNMVKSFSFSDINLSGYILVYSDTVIESNEYLKQKIYLQVYKNDSDSSIVSSGPYEITNGILSSTGTSIFNLGIDNTKIWSTTSYFNDIEINTQNNSFLITSNFRHGYYTGSEGSWKNDVTNWASKLNTGYNFSILQNFKISESGAFYAISRQNFGSNLYLPIKIDGLHDGESAISYKNYKITGIRIKLAKTNESSSSKDYLLTYYKKNIDGTRSNAYLKRLTLKSDFSVLLNQVSTELDNTEIKDSSTNILLEDVPSLDLKEEGKLVISWINDTNIKYLEKDIDQSTPVALFLNSTTPNNYDKSYLICLKDLLGAYKETIISYNNNDSNDSSNYESVNLQKVISSFNILSLKNNLVEMNVTASGEFNFTSDQKINFNDSLEVNKTSSTVTIKKNLILSSLDSAPISSTTGIEGQINYNGSNIYIYLGGAWKKFDISSL